MGRDVDTIVAERAAVLSHARVKRGQIAALVARGRLPAADGETLSRWIAAFADEIAIGLHRAGEDPAGVRSKMRAIAVEKRDG